MKILLLDTNISSFPIYLELKKLTNNVYVCGSNDEDFLARIARKKYIKLDYSDLQSLKRHILKENYSAVVPGCNDISYLTCSKIKESNKNVVIDPIDKTEILFNKEKFRSYSALKKLPVPKVFKVHGLNDIRVKVLVKPVDSYSGRGIRIIENEEELIGAIEEAKCYSRSKNFIIEEYVNGNLYSHTAFICNGKIVQDFIVAEYGSANEFVVDTSYIDYFFDKNLLKEIRQCIEYIVNDLKLQDGLLHTQLISNGNRFWLIELTRRCPGDLYSRLVELSTGYPYAKMYLKGFLGILHKEEICKKNDYVLRHTVTTDEELDFYSINYHVSINLIDYFSLAKSGERIKKSPFGRVGIMFVSCDNKNDICRIKDIIMRRGLYSLSV